MGNLGRSLAFLSVISLAWATSAPAAEHQHEQHGAHVHGEAQLLIATEGDVLEIEFSSPAVNLVGFEHRPATAAQRLAVANAVARLQLSEELFRLPAAARCEVVAAEIESPLIANAPGQEPGAAGTHSDFTAHYHYRCLDPGELRRIEVGLFGHFPAIETIEAQSISPRGQRQAELSSAQTVLEL